MTPNFALSSKKTAMVHLICDPAEMFVAEPNNMLNCIMSHNFDCRDYYVTFKVSQETLNSMLGDSPNL